MDKIYISDNYIIVENNGNIKPFPMNNSEYNEASDHFIIRKFPNKEVFEIPFSKVGNYFDELGTTPYSEDSLRNFLRKNTSSFRSASGGSGATNVLLFQIQESFSDFIDGEVVGQISHAKNSEGIRWSSAIGIGNYYPSGLYVWDGLNWVSDRNAIVDQLQNNIDNIFINSSDIDSLEQKDLQTESNLSEEILNRQGADELLREELITELSNRVLTNVPQNAVFTDTVYDDTAVLEDLSQLTIEIDQESLNRTQADNILGQNISSLAEDLLNEIDGRVLGEEALDNNIITLDNKLIEYSREYVISSNLGLINSTIGFEPFFIREPRPINVDNTGTWNVVIPDDGDYELDIRTIISYDSATSDFLGQILIDGTDTRTFARVEPKDTSGVGINLPTVFGGSIGAVDTSGTNQRIPAPGYIFLPGLIGGETKSFKLEFASQDVDLRATIYEATLSLRRIINSNT